MPKWLQNHGLSSAFAALFLLAVAGQSLAGYSSYNSALALHGFPRIGYAAYLATGNFLDGMFANWQAAILQLACLILFGERFREKGSPHSLKPKGDRTRRSESKRDGQGRPWIYRHSLSLAFALLFALTFFAHLFLGTMDYNQNLRMVHRPPISTLHYAVSAPFWFSNTKTWEAGFAAIAIYLVLSIFLRQQGSPESKPVDSSNKDTGETND